MCMCTHTLVNWILIIVQSELQSESLLAILQQSAQALHNLFLGARDKRFTDVKDQFLAFLRRRHV